jgi:hypothetical protein
MPAPFHRSADVTSESGLIAPGRRIAHHGLDVVAFSRGDPVAMVVEQTFS